MKVNDTIIKSALNAPGNERIKDFYEVGPVQRASVENFADSIASLMKSDVDRSEAVNLANNVIDGVLEGRVSPKGVLMLCQAVLRMDAALK